MPKIKINILKKGDSVVAINERIIAVQRKNGEVDIIPIIFEDGLVRVDIENIATISYGDNSIEAVIDDENGDFKVVTF